MSDALNLDSLLGGVETIEARPQDLPHECRLGVFGSRSLTDGRVFDLIHKHAVELNAVLIVTAKEPHGVCQIAQLYAQKTKIALQVHFLQGDKYARGMWEHRSDHVIANSDIILLVHDGESRGTYNEMQRTMFFKKPYLYERIPQDKTLKSIV